MLLASADTDKRRSKRQQSSRLHILISITRYDCLRAYRYQRLVNLLRKKLNTLKEIYLNDPK